MDIYADLWRLAGAMLAHVSVWFIGVLEVLVALRLMGFPVSYGEALALSLVKRVPDIALGLPSVFAWHTHEARALMRRRPVRS